MTRVVVVGDVLLDRDLVGRVDRVCPDAPVPVVDEELVLERPGGAGLAATLAVHAGVGVTLVCALAADDGARRLRRLLADHGIEVVALHDAGTTSEKLRVRVGSQSLLRLDRGAPGRLGPLPDGGDGVRSADAVLVADYGRGVASDPVVRRLLTDATVAGTPIVWDPHPRGARPVPGTAVVTPNRDEAIRFAGHEAHDTARPLAAAIAAGERLRREWATRMVSVTLGAEGAVAIRAGSPAHVVPVAVPAIGGDACGAGDAFAAATAVAFAAGTEPCAAIGAAVEAASRFVRDGGAAQLAVLPSIPAITDAGGTGARVTEVRRAGGTVVATGGCFDILHAGHVATLEHARRLGDHLVVLVNDDASVRRLKGPTRPVQRCEDRVALLRALECVDDVVVFGEDTPVAALRELQPDLFVKGGDYDPATMPESAVVATWGGAVVTVPLLDGRSTTRILGGPRPAPETTTTTTTTAGRPVAAGSAATRGATDED